MSCVVFCVKAGEKISAKYKKAIIFMHVTFYLKQLAVYSDYSLDIKAMILAMLAPT